jgi:hypothetical protein
MIGAGSSSSCAASRTREHGRESGGVYFGQADRYRAGCHPELHQRRRSFVGPNVKKVFSLLLSQLIMLPLPIIAQERPRHIETSAEQRDDLEAFSRMSAVEVARQYFEQPPYRLFAIRRLIELGDPVVLPVLHRFASETDVTRRGFIAAALVSLGDADADDFEYLADLARQAVKSDLPFPVPLSGAGGPSVNPVYRPEFLELVNERGLEFSTALQKATFEFPGDVEALGEAGDSRCFSILVQGLRSPNIMIVRAARRDAAL